MIDIRLNTLGRIVQGENCGVFIHVIDDAENTGGYLIFSCENQKFEGEVFDNWWEIGNRYNETSQDRIGSLTGWNRGTFQ